MRRRVVQLDRGRIVRDQLGGLYDRRGAGPEPVPATPGGFEVPQADPSEVTAEIPAVDRPIAVRPGAPSDNGPVDIEPETIEMRPVEVDAAPADTAAEDTSQTDSRRPPSRSRCPPPATPGRQGDEHPVCPHGGVQQHQA